MVLATSFLPATVEVTVGSSALLFTIVSVFFLTRALLPHQRGYNLSQQVAVTVGMTIVWVGFIELGLSHTSPKINFWPLVTALLIVSLVNLGIAGYLQWHVTTHNRSQKSSPTIRERIAHKWHTWSPRDGYSWLFLGFATAISLVLVVTFNGVGSRRAAFVEFFIDPSIFPEVPPWQDALAPGEPISIPVTVVSHETQLEHFYLQVLVNDVLYQSLDLGNLQPGQEVKRVISFVIDHRGSYRVGFHLNRDGESFPHRSLHIWLHVSP